MEPRILFIAESYKENNDLLNLLDDNNIFVRCDYIDRCNLNNIIYDHQINLILLDESCFSMMGFLNSIIRETAIILILHHHDEDIIKTSWNYNVAEVIVKPDYYGLLQTIHKVLKNHSH
ncbi:hypothetical protein [Halobacillus sp. Marseille-Q1614]|uniref:hypothetical protein n=1 Tax=Halobacillus sp. Marseille-Q1614 TaxID=2709134 RepID=UPI001570BC64|nr:hypothetical protein [Halobacillus sp. Marseille-Q1614]